MIRERSNSASAPRTCSSSLPCAFVVSMASESDLNPIPRSAGRGFW